MSHSLYSCLVQSHYSVTLKGHTHPMTRAEKVTISLPAPLLDFVTQYQQSHSISRSEVVQQALQALQDAELAQAYREAAAEMRADVLFDVDPSHGLTPSTEADW